MKYRYTLNQRRYGISLEAIQAERLRVKNARRQANGLAPLKSYADV